MGNPVITELWLFQMANPEEGSHTTVGIQIDKIIPREREGELVAGLVEAIQPMLKKDQSLDLLFLRGKFGQDVRARGARIFRRS